MVARLALRAQYQRQLEDTRARLRKQYETALPLALSPPHELGILRKLGLPRVGVRPERAAPRPLVRERQQGDSVPASPANNILRAKQLTHELQREIARSRDARRQRQRETEDIT